MRTPQQLYPDERIIYKPELSACPHCGGPLRMCNYLAWAKTVQTLDSVLSDARHHFCHSHYLKHLAEPLAKADSAFNVELRKAVRREVGLLIRAEKVTPTPQAALLTVTGLLPDHLQTTTEMERLNPEPLATPSSDTAVAEAVVTHLLRHTRYLLTLKGRPPFRLAGIETYQRLQRVIVLSEGLLAHRHEPRLARLSNGLQAALAPFATEHQTVQQGEIWLRDIDRILTPPDDHPTTGE